jgi:tetratricopeptide (TPR) repeat protein
MNIECRRWVSLADLEALGESLPSDAQAFLRAHEATCTECGREAAAWRAVKAPAEDAAPDDVEVENILALAAATRQRRAFAARRLTGALLVVGATACAAAAFLWLSATRTPERLSNNDRPSHGTTPAASLPRQAPPSQAALKPPSESGSEPGCSEVVPGALVCLAEGAALGRRALSGSERELEVTRGRVVVSLAPQPPGSSFSLVTSAGRVTAVGTIYSVDVSTDGSTVARVVEGKVLTRGVGEGAPLPLQAGQTLRLGDRSARTLSDEEREADLALLPAAEKSARGVARQAGSAKQAGPSAGPAAPQDTLEHARSLRASGDFPRAVEVYRRIYAASPRSPSGRAALVSLGDLLLTLHDARGALQAFDSYLVGGGTLAQEAAFGRARALRVLNRPAEERRAIERFLAAYPDAPQGRVLRARLTALQK